ncbi:hypothetical protein Vadar_023078 [Vaccinium darrowii]|uniref:Uncharacterized protein n=1 Tax=Vaccinium darrowii TaxID=229202 RepID=A0ACB7ZE83_9ERIC|nr:hypothetical protein Vadar_023078 [Vaccinium darrowii]
MPPILFLIFAFISSGGGLDFPLAAGISTIGTGKELYYGSFLESDGGNFTLGFFTTERTNYTYLGIWYTNDTQQRNGGNTVFNISNQLATNPTAKIEDTGNFVLTNGTDLWQSFDYPGNTLLPGMKLGFNTRTGQNWNLTSWSSDYSAATGAFTMGWEPTLDSGRFVSNDNEKYLTFSGINGSLWMWELRPDGQIEEGANSFVFGSKIFGPASVSSFCYGYESGDGCVTSELPQCRSSNDSNGTGCMTWIGKLEYQEYTYVEVINVLVRGSSSKGKTWIWVLIAVVISVLVLIVGIFCGLQMRKRRLEGEEKKRQKGYLLELMSSDSFNDRCDIEGNGTEAHHDLKILSFASIVEATNNFSRENKLGQGGFGPVYKNETEGITNRVVGTYGYMSPEYAMEGTFSEKSDVFSFGVLILEVVSGRRNTSFYDVDNGPLNLIGYAWELWKQGTALELKDPTLGDSCAKNEFLRIIQVGLLCVQEGATDRPTMSDVIWMLSNETMVLPAPTRPAFLTGRNVLHTTPPRGREPKDCTKNSLTISIMEPR